MRIKPFSSSEIEANEVICVFKNARSVPYGTLITDHKTYHPKDYQFAQYDKHAGLAVVIQPTKVQVFMEFPRMFNIGNADINLIVK